VSDALQTMRQNLYIGAMALAHCWLQLTLATLMFGALDFGEGVDFA
jgi:hypothetical protein